ncbi:LptF/LptG family permease [Pelagibacteraceae bacterium]|jgi:lipopolysaccharide export system permease protein|nr:LptF/LptG family permease [Pelagibacteraceae bacterium]
MLQNKIYQNYIIEILKSFFVILFSFSVIAWTVKAVNYLDLIVESGYSIFTYLSYSLLGLTGVLTKFIPLSFLVTIVFFISKQIEEKEFTILWSAGVKKIHMVNLLLLSSLIILIFYLIFSVFITPYTLNQSRKLLSDKNEISIFPILKENQFIDAYKGVTLIVGKKIENEVQNVFIFDNSNNFKNLQSNNAKKESLNIIAQKGIAEKDRLVLLNGQLVTTSLNDKSSKIVKFDQMNLNLGSIENNIIKKPKIQETSTMQLINCFTNKLDKNLFCNEKSKKEVIPNLNRRIILPIYIPIISLISCLLLANIKKNNFMLNKITIFLLSFFTLLFAELFIRYTGVNYLINYLFILFPLLLLPLMYLMLIQKFKKEIIYK